MIIKDVGFYGQCAIRYVRVVTIGCGIRDHVSIGKLSGFTLMKRPVIETKRKARCCTISVGDGALAGSGSIRR